MIVTSWTKSIDQSLVYQDHVSILVLSSSLHWYESRNILYSNVPFPVSIDIFDCQIDVPQIPMLPFLVNLLLPMNLSCLICINQTVCKLVVRFTHRQEWIDLLFRWKEDFLYRFNGIKKSQIFQLTVKFLPLTFSLQIVWMSIEWLFNSTEHMFCMP